MRPVAKGLPVMLLVCVAATFSAFAQGKRPPAAAGHKAAPSSPAQPRKPAATRTLTAGEGLAILSVALDFRHRPVPHPDCSHFVHELYERAGFSYEYAPSSDLYAGVDEFRRVESPQAGDLAVWPGHAGIVVSPLQHSFFSLLRSGPGVDSYDAPYWKQRGRPHFFRYVIAVPGPVHAHPVKTASWKPAVSSSAEEREGEVDDPASDESEISDSATAPGNAVAKTQAPNPTMPRAVIVNSVLPKPAEVSAAFLATCQNLEQNLAGGDLFQSGQSLIVFDRFEVKKVHVTGSQGWAEVQIDEPGSLTGNKAQVHKRSEQQRWSLTRRADRKSWELSPAPNTFYLHRNAAVRILARVLAELTEDRPDNAGKTQQKAELARLLNVLLEK